MNKAEQIIEFVSQAIWGYPVLILMIGGGIYLSFKMKFPQIRVFRIIKTIKKSLYSLGDKKDGKGITQFQGFSTALAATVGTGSIVGVGTAIAIGGAGAVFWMWVSAFFGMALSYKENILGVEYGKKTGITGAMSYIEKGLDSKWLAILFALFCTLASLGMGNMTQSNSISSACKKAFNLSPVACGILLTIIVAFIILGKNRLGRCTEKLVPLMSLFYILGAVVVIIKFHNRIPSAFETIIKSAFGLDSVVGGTVGYGLKQACITGLRRGAFSNEAGLGSTVAVHSSCEIKDPETQGCWGIAEVFIDTMIICTLTALVILVSDVEIKNGGSEVICSAFSKGLGDFGEIFMAVSMVLFAFATIIGWFFIGKSAWEYVFPKKSAVYKIIFLVCVLIGSELSLSIVWGISDIFNGLMALPNLIAILLLSSERVCKKSSP